MQADCILTAVIVISIVIIFHGSFFGWVINVDIFVRWYLIESEVVAIDFITAIVRCVVGDNSIVIGVVLCEDRVKIVLYPEACVVFIARNQDAERQFFFVLRNFMNLICFGIGKIELSGLSIIIPIVYLVVK